MIPTDILNYRVVRLLGHGGMGYVYLAVNTNMDQQVAIKVLRPEVAQVTRARFKQEAELLSSLDHPGIVKFLNYVETAEGVFLIMEYVKGVTLEDFIKKKNGLIVEKKAYPIISEILDAFSYAHSKGIVHRDIKPSNIIIQEDGHIKIMDFGIAQIISESNIKEERIMVLGTPTYMSPEQVLGSRVDERSDIYSIGVLIHNMLTGCAPYDSTTMTEFEISSHIVKDKLARMSNYYPYVSDKIQQIVDKATQKDPEARFQNCKEMKVAVKKSLAPDPIHPILLYSAIGVIVALLLGCLLTWDYYRTKVHYYKDYTEVFGVPEGICRLSGREVSYREASYKFEYNRYKLRRVSYVNSKGKLVDHHDSEDKDKIVDMTLTYTEGSGKVDAAKYMNRSGKVLYVKDYDSNFKTCTFKLDDELGTEMTLNSQVSLFQSAYDTQLEGKSKISKYILEYDNKGRLAKVEYAGFGNIRVPDGQGIFGRKYVYDEEGRVIQEHYLGRDGNAKATQFGLGIKLFTYDGNDNLIKIEYQTTEGKPSSDGNNCPVVLLTYDKWGNRISERYTDVNGDMMVRKDSPFAGILYEYNNHGFITKEMYLGLNDNITYIDGVSGFINEYDENGYLSKRTMIDVSGKAIFYNDNDGHIYSKLIIKSDKNGNCLDMQLLNADEQLMDGASWAHKKCTYDSLGNQLSEYYYNSDGELYAPASLGYAGVTMTYNQQGRIKTITYMDADEKRINLADKHLCYVDYEYDARGNYTRRSYFDNTDKLVMTDVGVAVVCYEYDDNGNEVSRYFLDNKENPCVHNYYCSRCEYKYDEQGNIIEERYKDSNGQLMTVDGKTGVNRTFDERGRVIIFKPININGGLASNMYEERYKYDNRDNVTEKTYFGNSGKAVNCNDGYHKVLFTYNSTNQIIQEEYYNTNGHLANVKGQKYAIIKREFDEKSNNTSTTFFTQTGSRGSDKDKVHKYYNQFDKIVNKVCHQLSFGIDGKPIVVRGLAKEGRIEYDERGNLAKLICYDGYGKKCNGEHGWCEMRCTYDESGLLTSQSYFSIDDKPIVDKDAKYHKILYKYNDMRLKESETYIGTNGKPINLGQGYSTIKYEYNNQNQCVQITYFASNGKATNNTSGWHREHYFFKGGHEYKCDLFDVSGRKIATATRVNNTWDIEGIGQNDTDWRYALEELSKICPTEIVNGVIIEKIIRSNEIVTIYMRFEDLTEYEISKDMITDLQSEIKNVLKSNLNIPDYIEINFVIYNKNHEKLII